MSSLQILLIISLCLVARCVYIEKNGYKEVTFSFSKDVLSGFDLPKLKDILVNASNILFNATRERAYFEDFLFVVPSTFQEKDICDELTEKAPQNIDIYVTGSPDISELTTRHSKRCGEKGEIIYLPKDWMKDGVKELALQFVQQWSVFRYGVFPENPERNGSCFAQTDSKWSPTGCYNIDLDEEIKLDENGLPVCHLPSNFSEEDLHSSIMFSSANSLKVLHFCDSESEEFPHIPFAPTLHNRICDGKSVWSVIENTEDFKYGRNWHKKDSNSSKIPTFRCFKESKTHLTIMIQDTDSKARSEIRYALSYFFSIIESADFNVSLATFSSDSKTNDGDFVDIDLQNKANLKSQLESLVKLNEKVSDVCLTCGLRKAYKVSETSQYVLRTIILIARESSLENMKNSEIKEIITRKDAVLQVLILEDTASDIIPSSFIEIIQNNRGRVFRLKNEPVFMVTELTTALLDASKNILHIEDKILVVHKSISMNVESDFNDIVSIPKGAKGKLLYSMQFKKRGDLKSVNEKCKDMDSDLQSPVFGSEIDVREDKEPENVTYSFRYTAGSEGTTCSSLALLKLQSSSKNLFTIRGWLSETEIIPGQNTMIIYAEIYNRLYHNVTVEARISGPGLLKDFLLELRDNGNGDPDIIKGDNIYSRYFTSFSHKGTYTVSIVAEILKPQKSTEENSAKIETNVSQIKTIGTFRVIQTPPKEDILPPNRVGDLKIISIDHGNRTFSIQWTAPGDDYDHGKANKYKIYFTEDWKNLEEGMLKKILIRTFNTSEIEPKKNGIQEIKMFQLPKTPVPKTYFIALKTVDKKENEGKLSNVIQAVLLLDNLLINNSIQHNDTETASKYHKDNTEINYAFIYIISGVVFSIIFLVIVTNILIWIVCFRKYKKRFKAVKVKSSDRRGENINSDENILQSEIEDSQVKEYTQDQKVLYNNTGDSNPMLIYSKVQKRNKNQEPSNTYKNENFKSQEMSYQNENDLGFI